MNTHSDIKHMNSDFTADVNCSMLYKSSINHLHLLEMRLDKLIFH